MTGPITGHELRTVMGEFVTGVTILCSGRPEPHGITLNAFTSVSLDPPQVLVCVDEKSRMRQTLTDDGAFTISVLGADQTPVARHFATKDRPFGKAGFDGFETVSGDTFGHPIFANCVAWLECSVDHTRHSGDHIVVTGTVINCGRSNGTTPLLFSNGQLHPLSTPVNTPRFNVA